MQTIIHKTNEYTDSDNIVFVIEDVRSLEQALFSPAELKFMAIRRREHKQDLFTFNRLDNWVIVLFVDRERNRDERLETLRLKGAGLQSFLNEQKVNSAVVIDSEDKPAEMLAFAEGLSLRNYQFLKYKSKPDDKAHSLSSLYLYSKGLTDEDIEHLNIVLDATSRCRNMVNEPVAFLNAVRFAETMEAMVKSAGGKAEVLNKKKLEALKMGGILAVNRGSVDPPTLTIMEWKPEGHVNTKPYVLVGKGVVFDTGGMNIKTGNFMNDMKSDMAGGAAVSSAIYAVARARLPVHVIALVPASDNRVHGNAYVNGDIITMYDGSRVEIVNTDAEGRMLLADALSYAKKFDPKVVIDLATLTGSAMRAIGAYGIVAMQVNAVSEFTNLKKSGDRVRERLVEFPMWKEYREELNSDIADLKHLGGANAGSITAAKFLEHFTDYPFIHLDIAGVAFAEKAKGYRTPGGTGAGVRLLFDYIKNKVQ